MLKSMTGFGRCEMATDEYKISVEMKAVNHRYLDLSIKMPKKFNYFEAAIRAQLKKYIQRGKVDVFISYEDYTDEKMSLKYNRSLAGEYMDYFRQMADELGIPNDATVMRLARCPEVFTMEQVPEDEEHMWAMLQEVLKGAAENFMETRLREGENLKNDLIGKLDHMLSMVDFIEERSPKILEEYRQRLGDKVRELLQNSTIDESRILTEVTVFADKICVDEETVRLRSHLSQLEDMLEQGGAVGRKLDFLIQEFNREANTIGSKCSDVALSRVVVELKGEIEKIREQVQNIE